MRFFFLAFADLDGLTMSLEGGLEEFEEFFNSFAICSGNRSRDRNGPHTPGTAFPAAKHTREEPFLTCFVTKHLDRVATP